MEKPQVTDDNDSKQNFFSNFSSIVGKVANNATTVIKDKVNTSMIAEFNKEQEDFIKNKGKHWRSMAKPSRKIGTAKRHLLELSWPKT